MANGVDIVMRAACVVGCCHCCPVKTNQCVNDAKDKMTKSYLTLLQFMTYIMWNTCKETRERIGCL